jgi:hypothetical protein
MKRIRRFDACVTYRGPEGVDVEEIFPVYMEDYLTAKAIALSYVLQVLKLQDFELRMVGA